MGKENENQVKRNSQAGRQLESSSAEKILNGVISSANLKLNNDKRQLEQATMERQAMIGKIDRRKADLDRLKQRLDTLQKIRPAFSEEFEKAEEELQKLFGDYFIHVRCLDALRIQMNANAKSTQAVSEPMSKSSAPPSMLNLLPDGILDISDELSNDGDDEESKPKLIAEPNRNPNEEKIEKKPDNEAGKSKLRIKTGGKDFFHFLL